MGERGKTRRGKAVSTVIVPVIDPVIEALQQGSIPASMDIAIGMEPDQYFRGKDPTCGGKHPNAKRGEVLDLEEAPEPEEIYFENVGLASPEQRSMQKLVMLLWLFFFMGLTMLENVTCS